MRFNELLEKLKNQTGRDINQAELGRIINCSRSKINYKKTNNVLVDDVDVQKIETFYNVNITGVQISTSDINISIKYYPDVYATCGEGGFADNNSYTFLDVPKSFISNYNSNNDYSIITARSDSMMPLIQPNDYIIIKNTNIIDDNKIHIFFLDGKLFCKYLSFNLDEVLIRSANSEYKNMSVKYNDIKIQGVVVGSVRKF